MLYVENKRVRGRINFCECIGTIVFETGGAIFFVFFFFLCIVCSDHLFNIRYAATFELLPSAEASTFNINSTILKTE